MRTSRTALAVLTTLASLAATVLIGSQPAAAAACGDGTIAFSGGDGSTATPFRISSEADLISLRDSNTHGYYDCAYRQTTDITIVGAAWKHGIGFTASAAGAWWAPFQGVYDGGSYAVRNLVIDGSLEADVTHQARELGFIGITTSANGLVQRLNLENVSVTCGTEGQYAAMLIGETEGTVRRSSATGTVDCTNGSTVAHLGGLIGYTNGAVSNAWTSGTVTLPTGAFLANTAGGAIGKSAGSSSVRNVLARVGLVNETQGVWVGSYTGRSEGLQAHGFAQSGLTAGITLFGAVANAGDTASKTAAELKNIATFPDWSISQGVNGSTIWGIDPGVNGGFPFLRAVEDITEEAALEPEVNRPTFVLQQFAVGPGDSCSGVNDRSYSPVIDVAGGWTVSWSQWPNGGLGGQVCSRSLVFSGGSWHLQ